MSFEAEGKEFFVMNKRSMIKPLDSRLEADPCSSAVWMHVGRQLRRRRAELGFGIDHVARSAGISAGTYEGYELGVQTPAVLLAELADLFSVPVVWFFQGVTREEAAAGGDALAVNPAVYKVATVEHRVQALADSFRKLDLEGQQHLLAVSRALSQADPNGVRD